MDLNRIGQGVTEIIKETGEFILRERETFTMKSAETKGYHDFFSYVDKEAEQMIVSALKKLLPESGFIAEEQTAHNEGEDYLWIIDPLDGTTNFMHGVPPFSISIALQYKEKAILGFVYELGRKELFYSWDGIGVFCNDKSIQASQAESISDSLLSTGFHINDFDRLTNHLKVVEHIIKNSHGLRRHGSAATDLAYTAAGRFDGFFEYGLSAWDVAAGAYLIERAGGKISDYSGGNNYLFGREFCAGAPKVHKELLELLKDKMFDK